MTKFPLFTLHLQPPFFEAIQSGRKKIEGRLGKKKYLILKKGDTIIFNDLLEMTVESVRHYPCFEQMLECEGIDRVLPGVSSVREGCAIYREFYTEEDEKLFGVLAIELM